MSGQSVTFFCNVSTLFDFVHCQCQKYPHQSCFLGYLLYKTVFYLHTTVVSCEVAENVQSDLTVQELMEWYMRHYHCSWSHNMFEVQRLDCEWEGFWYKQQRRSYWSKINRVIASPNKLQISSSSSLHMITLWRCSRHSPFSVNPSVFQTACGTGRSLGWDIIVLIKNSHFLCVHGPEIRHEKQVKSSTHCQ